MLDAREAAAAAGGARRAVRHMRRLTLRERRRLTREMREMRDLVSLVMKPRAKSKWSRDDKALLGRHVKRICLLGPYLAVLVLPGGLLALPALAWWKDRRRLRDRAASPAR